MKVLIIEDDQELLRTIVRYFDTFGYVTEKAKSVQEAKNRILKYNYDSIVLDINLPDGNGFELLDYLNDKEKNSSVLILSASNDLDDKLKGLDMGADDYLTKPFHLSELNARLRSIVRRNKYGGKSEIILNEIRIETDSHDVFVNQSLLSLTKKEYEILLFLVTNKNRVVTKQSLSDHIWGDHSDIYNSNDLIYSHLKNLRKKITDHGGKDYIKTIYGIGYKFSINT